MKFSSHKDQLPLKERIVLTVEDVMALSGFGLSTVYRAMDEGKLVARKEGIRTVILREDFDAWLKNLPKKFAAKKTPDRETCNDG